MSHRATTSFHWLRTGEQAFARMLAAIEAAKQSVRLETYIFGAGKIGFRFREALTAAAQKGLRVQVLIDALGSYSLSTDFGRPIIDAGGEFRWFNPINVFRLEYRNHRKALVCDEHVAFIGGFNIASEYEGDGVTQGWCDLGMEISGPLAKELARSFDTSFARADFRHHPFHQLRRARARRS